MSVNPTLALCELAKPHLIEGSRLFASQSVVVAVNNSQPLADRLADIDLTIRLLTTLGAQLAKDSPGAAHRRHGLLTTLGAQLAKDGLGNAEQALGLLTTLGAQLAKEGL